jgi:hypothetical protein
MSKDILCDGLGVDGDLALKNIKKSHTTLQKKQKRKLEMVYDAVAHFEQKMKKRRIMLHENIKKSKSKTYERRTYWWREEYDAIMAEKRYNRH